MDNSGLKVNLFDFPLEVQYVRLVPIICHRGCTLRFELLGCEVNGEYGVAGALLQMGFPAHFLLSQVELGRTAARPGDLGSHSRCTPEAPPGPRGTCLHVCGLPTLGIWGGGRKKRHSLQLPKYFLLF